MQKLWNICPNFFRQKRPCIFMNASFQSMKIWLRPLCGRTKKYRRIYRLYRIPPFCFEAEFSPGIEIGWRISRKHWNQGYATEAAKACLDYAQKKKLFKEIYSFTATCNHRSERIMQKIGMMHHGYFSHPALPDGHRLKQHTLYRLELNR